MAQKQTHHVHSADSLQDVSCHNKSYQPKTILLLHTLRRPQWFRAEESMQPRLWLCRLSKCRVHFHFALIACSRGCSSIFSSPRPDNPPLFEASQRFGKLLCTFRPKRLHTMLVILYFRTFLIDTDILLQSNQERVLRPHDGSLWTVLVGKSLGVLSRRTFL